jgi:hypothetical protein
VKENGVDIDAFRKRPGGGGIAGGDEDDAHTITVNLVLITFSLIILLLK